jgi:hypothetical protein
MQLISLNSLLGKDGEESETRDYLSSFLCEKNKDVEKYLHSGAIYSENRDFSRTTIVIDEKNNNNIIGYFTLLVKNFSFKEDVSGSIKNKLTGSKKSSSFVTVLIAQLGRADTYKGIVDGSVILELALQHCKQINELSAVKVASVEYGDIGPLKKFYSDNGFNFLQKNETGNLMSYVRL